MENRETIYWISYKEIYRDIYDDIKIHLRRIEFEKEDLFLSNKKERLNFLKTVIKLDIKKVNKDIKKLNRYFNKINEDIPFKNNTIINNIDIYYNSNRNTHYNYFMLIPIGEQEQGKKGVIVKAFDLFWFDIKKLKKYIKKD